MSSSSEEDDDGGIRIITSNASEDENDGEGSRSDDAATVSGSDSDTPVHRKPAPSGRKIICLQTQHLQENHEYWVARIKVN